jgi:hypothetical protein
MNTNAKTTTITAVYKTASIFNVDFDLKSAHEYWVKWDTLFVVHNDGEDAVEYSAVSSAEDDHECYKAPVEVLIE